MERVWEVYNAAWSRNWGFVPMTREEFFCMGKEMKQILKPELVLIGEVGGTAWWALRWRCRTSIWRSNRPAGICFPRGCSKSCIIND